MKYIDFKGKQLSMLGFGAMRLPTLGSPEAIDEQEAERIIDRAILGGVNYFDTAFPYHGGKSESVVGRILSKYPRESYYLATKFPGHQIMSDYNPEKIFEEQLEKCGVDYFDFYLLHNVNEVSMATYLDPRYGIIDYFKKQKELGRIRHLGFSTHGMTGNLAQFLEIAGSDMEFCQIQLNYLDYSLQRAKEKCEMLNSYNIPIWVMEPVRGGKLAKGLPEESKQKLLTLRPDESVASWCFRFLMDIPGVSVILSGMSDMEQVEDNIRTFNTDNPLSEYEVSTPFEIAEGMKSSVPCTSCGYCMDGCPMGLDIPTFMELYNEAKVSAGMNIKVKVEFLPEDKQPTACIGCASCVAICPQKIDIPKVLGDFSAILEKVPSWKEISKSREMAAENNRRK